MQLKYLKSANVESSTLSISFRKIWHYLKWRYVPIYFDHGCNHEIFSFLKTEEKYSSETNVFSFNLFSVTYMQAKCNSWRLWHFIRISQIEGVFLRLATYSILIAPTATPMPQFPLYSYLRVIVLFN